MIVTTIRKIFDEMMEYGEQFASTQFSPSTLTRVLRKFIGSHDVSVKMNRTTKVDINQIVIGGVYDPDEDEENYRSITVYVNYNPNQSDIYIKDLDWKAICIDLLECVGHEVVHRRQYRDRNFDVGPGIFVSTCEDPFRRMEQDYLGSPDEIEAYGYSIATQIFLHKNPRQIAHKHFKDVPMFMAYVDAFGMQHPIIRKLIQYSAHFFNNLKGAPNVKKSRQTN